MKTINIVQIFKDERFNEISEDEWKEIGFLNTIDLNKDGTYHKGTLKRAGTKKQIEILDRIVRTSKTAAELEAEANK